MTPNSKKEKSGVTAAFITIAFIFFLGYGAIQGPTKSSDKAVQQDAPHQPNKVKKAWFNEPYKSYKIKPCVPGPVTKARHAWARQYITELFHTQAEIYPIEKIRKRIHRLSRRVQSGEIILLFSSECTKTPKYGEAKIVKGYPPGIIIYLHPIREMFRANQRGMHAYVDQVVVLLLHEEFHIDKIHMPMTSEEAIAAESEAWHFVTKELLLPIKAQGRLWGYNSPLQLEAIAAYNATDGDENHPTWHQFILDFATPQVEK